MNMPKLVIVLFTLLVASPARSDTADSDQAFLEKALDCMTTQIKVGQLAEKKGNDASVREFGARMAEAHTKLRKDLTDCASNSKIAILAGTDKQQRQLVADLNAMEDAVAFDKAFLNAVIDEHNRMIERCQAFVKETKNDDLKKCGEDCLTKMKEHRDEAKKLLDNLK